MLQRSPLESLVLSLFLSLTGLSLAYAQNGNDSFQDSQSQEQSDLYESDFNVDPYEDEAYFEDEAWREPAAIDEQDYQDLMELDEEEEMWDPGSNTGPYGDVYEDEGANFESDQGQRGPASIEDQGREGFDGTDGGAAGDSGIYDDEFSQPDAVEQGE